MQKTISYEEAMIMFAEGISCKEISRKVGISESCIVRHANKMGVIRPNGYKPDRRGHKEEVPIVRSTEPLEIKKSFFEDCKRIMNMRKHDNST